MVEAVGCGELQQLVSQEEECEEPLNHGGEATPPSTPARSQRPSKTEVHNSNISVHVIIHIILYYTIIFSYPIILSTIMIRNY